MHVLYRRCHAPFLTSIERFSRLGALLSAVVKTGDVQPIVVCLAAAAGVIQWTAVHRL